MTLLSVCGSNRFKLTISVFGAVSSHQLFAASTSRLHLGHAH